MIFFDVDNLRQRSSKEGRRIIEAPKSRPKIGLVFLIKYCVLSYLLRCYGKILHNQTFELFFRNAIWIIFRIELFSIFHSIQIFKHSVIIQLTHIFYIPVGTQKVLSLISKPPNTTFRHFTLFLCHRFYSDQAASIHNFTNLWRLWHTQLIAEPSFFRVFPFFESRIRNVRNSRLVVSIPDSSCTHNIHIRSIKNEFHSAQSTIIVDFINHHRASFPFHTFFQKTVNTFIILHVRIRYHRSNWISCVLYLLLNFKNRLIIQNNIRCYPFICCFINVKIKFHQLFTVSLSFFPFLFIYRKIVALFPLYCSLFLSIFCFLRGRYFFRIFHKRFSRNTIFFSTGTHETPNQKYHDQ